MTRTELARIGWSWAVAFSVSCANGEAAPAEDLWATYLPGHAHGVAVSGDVFVAAGSNIYRLTRDTGAATPFLPASDGEDWTRIAADDSTLIAVANRADGATHQWSVVRGASAPFVLAEGPGHVRDLAAGDGEVFAVVDGEGPRLVRVDAAGNFCSSPARAGVAAVAVVGSNLWIAGADTLGVFVQVTPRDTCGACACAFSEERRVPVSNATVADAVYHDSELLVAGFSLRGEIDGAGFLARFGEDREDFLEFDPTEFTDGLTALAVVEGGVVAGGAQGWQRDPGFGSATGVLARVTPNSLESSVLPASSVVSALEADRSGIIAVVQAAGTGAVVRCDSRLRCGRLDRLVEGDTGGGTADASVEADAAVTDTGVMDSSVDGSDTAPPDGGSGAPFCVRGSVPDFEVTDANRSLVVPLPLDADVAYSRLRVSYEVRPAAWAETCWNPAGHSGAGKVAGPFQLLLEVRRGARFCRGGNLLELATRSAPTEELWGESYWSDIVSSSCVGDQWQVWRDHPPHRLTPGVWTPLDAVLDTTADRLDVTLGSVAIGGTTDPRIEIANRPGAALHLVIGTEEFLECFEPPGGDPDPSCCHIPSIGWGFRSIRWEACRTD